MENPQKYTMKHRLAYYECDQSSHPSLSMLVAMGVLASERHADVLNCGRQAGLKYNGAWIILSYEGRISQRQPVFGDEVVLGTSLVGVNRFFAQREFWLADATGFRFATMTGQLGFVDLSRRRIQAIPDELVAPFHAPKLKRLTRPRNQDPLSADVADGQSHYQVRYFDIDGNRHVNNVRYFDWMLDSMGADFLNAHQLRRFNISYKNEVRYPSRVTSRYQLTTDERGTVKSINQIFSHDQLSADAEFAWQKRTDK